MKTGDALFYSESQSSCWEQTLEKGKPTVNTDDADRNFVSQYGYLYRLPSLYATGYPVYFSAMLDGTVTLHADFAEQATGLTQNGYDVYMAIDAKASKFNPETGELNLVAEFYTYQSQYIVSYGVYNEVLSTVAPDFPYAPAADLKADFAWTPLFTDTFTSKVQADTWVATLEEGYCTNSAAAAAFEKAYGTAYRIPGAYVSGYDIYFVANEEGEVSVPAGYELQATGTSIYGTPAYIKILKGTMANTGVTLSVTVCDQTGKALMPATCTESLLTYNWMDVATGAYEAALYEAPVTGRKLQHAEGTNLYRVNNYIETGKHLVFSWNAETNKCDVDGLVDTGVDSSPYGGMGNFFVCDARGLYLWAGKDYSWELLEKNGYQQPYYDPATKTFHFELFYACPALGVGVGLDFYPETFTLDGEIAEAKWVAVGTGSYSAPIFTDQAGNPYVAQGVVLENKENTSSYRLVDWLESGDANINLPFALDAANKVAIDGIVDSGLPGSIFGGYSTNAYVCDVLTLYTQMLGKDVTWDDLIGQYGAGIQPSYNPETKTYTMVVAYIFPKDGVILGNSFFSEKYVLDQSASTTASAPVFTKVSSEKIELKGACKFVNANNISNSFKSVRPSTSAVKELKTPKSKQTPEKRSRIVEHQFAI